MGLEVVPQALPVVVLLASPVELAAEVAAAAAALKTPLPGVPAVPGHIANNAASAEAREGLLWRSAVSSLVPLVRPAAGIQEIGRASCRERV